MASRVIREGFRVLQILGTLSVFNPIQIKAFQGRDVSPDLLRFSKVVNRIADLEQAGLISAEEGSYRGRPQYRYSATPKGHRLSELLQAIKKL